MAGEQAQNVLIAMPQMTTFTVGISSGGTDLAGTEIAKIAGSVPRPRHHQQILNICVFPPRSFAGHLL